MKGNRLASATGQVFVLFVAFVVYSQVTTESIQPANTVTAESAGT